MMPNMAQLVYEKRPVFAEIIQQYGNAPFIAYLNTVLPIVPRALDDRKKEFLQHFEEFLKTWVAENEIEHILKSFSQSWTACTADHHGVPWHPFFVNENLAHARFMHNRNISHAVVFSASGVSLGNSSLPRSLGFHDASGTMRHTHFFPASARAHPVYGMPAIHLETTQFPDGFDFLKKTQQAETFSRQITQMTTLLWNQVPANQFARLAYIPLEELIVYILVHLETSHPLWQLITTKIKSYEKAMVNIQGAHTEDLSHGSTIFWHRTKEGIREQLLLDEEVLHNKDNSWRVALTTDALKESLKKQEIYPTYALCLMITSCYFGITCMGGFSQVGYLAEIHAAYKTIAPECNLPALMNNNPSVFCGEFIAVNIKNGDAATLIDIIQQNDYTTIIATLETTPLKDLVAPIIHELYKIIA